MIKAILDGVNATEEEVIEQAIGERDTNGNEFKVITLVSRERTRTKMKDDGYQNTQVFMSIDGSGPRIEHEPEALGCAMFYPDKMGRLVAKLAATPWNMKTLASVMATGLQKWKIQEKDIENEVIKMSKEITLTKNDRKMIKDAGEWASVAPPVNPEQFESSIKPDQSAEDEKPAKEDAGLADFLQKATQAQLVERAKKCTGYEPGKHSRAELVDMIKAYEIDKQSKQELVVE